MAVYVRTTVTYHAGDFVHSFHNAYYNSFLISEDHARLGRLAAPPTGPSILEIFPLTFHVQFCTQKRHMDANYVQMLWGFGGGVLSCIITYGILALKLFRLQMQLGAVREAILSLRNQKANQVRQSKSSEEAEFLQSLRADPKPRERYANDPW